MSDGQQPIKPHSSGMRIIAWCLGVFALLVVIAFFGLPMFFSTSTGKNMLAEMIGKKLGMQVQLDEVSLSWFGSQTLTGVHAQKPEDALTIDCPKITTDAHLFKLVIQNDVGHLRILSPQLKLSKPFHPMTQVQLPRLQTASFTPTFSVELPTIEMPMKGQVIVENGKATFNPPGLEPIIFDQIALSLDMNEPDKIALTLSGNTTQGQSHGQITAKAFGTQLNTKTPELSAQATISQLPMRAVDQFVSLFYPQMNGLLINVVGDTIDLRCNFSSSSGNLNLNLTADSPLMAAQIATQSNNGRLSLKAPATLEFNVTPALIRELGKHWPSLSTLALSQPALFQVTLSQFSADENDLRNAAFQAAIQAPDQLALTVNGKPLVLNALSLNANSTSVKQGIDVSAATSLIAQGQNGSFNFQGHFVPDEKTGFTGNLAVKAQQFPLDLIGAFVATPIPFSTLLGPTADWNATLNLTTSQPKLQLFWRSAYLNLTGLDITLNDRWTLASPASFTYTVSPQLIAAILPNQQIKLVRAEPIQGVIKTLSFPKNDVKNLQLDASLTAGPIVLNGNFPFTFSRLQALLAIRTLDQISLQVSGEPLQASLAGAFNPNSKEFTLTKPLTIQATVDTALLKALSPSAPQLAKPAVVVLSVDAMTIPLSGPLLKAKGQLSTQQIIFVGQTPDKQIALQNLTLPFQWDSKAKTAALQLNAQVKNPSGDSGTMQGQFALSNLAPGFNLSTAAINGTLDLQNISAAFLDAFAGKQKLSAIAGPTFSSKITLQSASDKQNVALKWVSANVKADAAFVVDRTSLRLQGNNNQLTWTLTPESYRAFDALMTGPTKGMAPFDLKEPSTFTITLSKMVLPVATKQSRIPDVVFDMNALQLTANGTNPKLTFYDKSSQETIQLSGLSFSLNKSAAQGPLSLSLDSDVVTQGTAAKNGSISVAGRIEPTRNAQGAFDISQLTGNLQLKAQQFPSRVLDLFARAKGRTDFPFTTLFGNVINAALSLDLKKFSGPVSLNLNTPLTRASVNGTLVNGALMLSDPIYAQLKITPEVSRLVLKEVNPLNLSYIYSEDPITLEIPAQGFYLPLYPTNLAKIAIPEATIELGKIFCRNEGNVNITLGLLKTQKFDKNSDLMLWFAPIDFSIKQGFANIGRTEILLANTYDICVWGKIDLLQKYVDMVLGLTAQTLSQAFGIKNLPENYVLTLPMKGPADNVQINTGKATAKVALLLAWQQQNIGGAIGGTAGAIVGGLINKLATLPDSDAKVPPAKHPFPWEIGAQPAKKPKKTSNEPHEKKRHFKQRENPLKQILKVIK